MPENYRILIIDGEAGFTGLFKAIVEKTGEYKVRVHGFGAGAVEAALDFRPHIIFLEAIMPDCEGGEVAARIQATTDLRGTPVIFLTGSDVIESSRQKRIDFGGNPYLAKPVTVQDILNTLKKYLVTR